jgi:hypothetical protein
MIIVACEPSARVDLDDMIYDELMTDGKTID